MSTVIEKNPVQMSSNVVTLQDRRTNRKVLFSPRTNLELLQQKSGMSASFLPGTEALGAGYDIFGEYASAKSITVQLFDWSGAETKNVDFKSGVVIPSMADAQQQDSASYNMVTGNTITEYQKMLSVSAEISGSYGLFSGSLSNDFNSNTLRKAVNEFSRIQQSITLWSLAIRPNYSKLRDLLYEDVRKNIDAAKHPDDFARLFDMYGSHFLTNLIMGGRAVFASSTNKVTVDKTFSNETIAKASYEGLTGQLSAEGRTKYESSMHSFQSNSESKHLIVGGSGVLAAKAFSGAPQDFINWQDSVGNSPDFIEFNNENALTGIWELAKHDDIRNHMKDYFEKEWLPEETKKHQVLPNYIDQLIVIRGGSSSINPPTGYTKIDHDLNKGAGGDYIYLCYHDQEAENGSSENPECIAELTTVKGDHKHVDAPHGFQKIDIDLNKGAGGKYIYLCYKNAPYTNEASIKSVAVVGGSNADVQPPYGYTRIDQDVNEGAGGDYTYICYSTMDD